MHEPRLVMEVGRDVEGWQVFAPESWQGGEHGRTEAVGIVLGAPLHRVGGRVGAVLPAVHAVEVHPAAVGRGGHLVAVVVVLVGVLVRRGRWEHLGELVVRQIARGIDLLGRFEVLGAAVGADEDGRLVVRVLRVGFVGVGGRGGVASLENNDKNGIEMGLKCFGRCLGMEGPYRVLLVAGIVEEIVQVRHGRFEAVEREVIAVGFRLEIIDKS